MKQKTKKVGGLFLRAAMLLDNGIDTTMGEREPIDKIVNLPRVTVRANVEELLSEISLPKPTLKHQTELGTKNMILKKEDYQPLPINTDDMSIWPAWLQHKTPSENRGPLAASA
jgi:hypothetical protein